MSSDDEMLSDIPDDNLSERGSENGGDLFGDDDNDDDGGEEKEGKKASRDVDNEDVDSGDDQKVESIQLEEKQVLSSQFQLPRHVIPQPSDNELYLLKVPTFLTLDPKPYQPENLTLPTAVHPPQPNAYKNVLSTIRWRHSPSNAVELQSNARVLRWSDGSLTIQHANDATAQYSLSAKALAAPQANPPKPTPTMVKGKKRRGGGTEESWTYICSPLPNALVSCFQTIGKVTTGLQVHQAAMEDAEEDLKASMAALTAKYAVIANEKQPKIELLKGDPSLIIADEGKDMPRRPRKDGRDRDRMNRSGRFGLTIDGLEGGSSDRRPRAQRARPNRRSRGNRQYSDELVEDEEDFQRSRPQDDYDMDDGFLVSEDENASEDGEVDDVDIDEIIERNERARKKRGDPKRNREKNGSSPVSKAKRRKVSEEEDDD